MESNVAVSQKDLKNIYLYGEHLKVDKELSDVNARKDYISMTLEKAKSCGADAVFLADRFHNAYYSLCSVSQLSDCQLSYADCKLIENFIGSNKVSFQNAMSNMLGCNYDNFEGLNFGLTSLLVQSGLVKKSDVSRWVLSENELSIPAEDIKWVYGPYIFVPNGTKRSPVFEKCIRDMYRSDDDSIVLMNLFGSFDLSEEEFRYYDRFYTLRGRQIYKDKDSIPVKTLVTDRLTMLWDKLTALGFRSLNAVGFYLMNGMEGYFETLSANELSALKFILGRLGIYFG